VRLPYIEAGIFFSEGHKMLWAKRQFRFGSYSVYQNRIADMHLKLPRTTELMMVLSPTTSIGVDDVYIGLPDKSFLPLFDGFEVVSENQLPAEASPLYLDHSTGEFEKRFKLVSLPMRRKR
jgi:hypothetical protein